MSREIIGGLVEREKELALIRDAVDRTASGSGTVLVVEGPAGIGKTRLLEAAQAIAAERRMLVLRATGGELEVDLAYGVVRQLFDGPLAHMGEEERSSVLSGAARLAAPLLGHTANAEIAPSTISALDPSPGILHGLHWLTANLAADAQVLLLVDDAHWADVPSLRFLVYLARRLDGIPVVIAVAARYDEPGQQRDLVAQLVVAEPARVLRPRALSSGGTRRVVDAVLGKDATHDFAAACHTVTKGNPYLLGELLASLRSEGLDRRGTADRVAELGPATVDRSVLLRLRGLPAPAASLSRALAVLGGGADLAHAAALAGLDRDDAVAAVDALA